ncbi:helix-turn-helix domain-containing protein [Litoreibacter albidus]|uniref:helix-turn-helix domain-containing protein n=1 Tax=Litoreibacter albidus TaxID=670155 RepID=UPI003735E8C0
MARNKPYGGTNLAAFITMRITELRPRKSQAEIASEAGFANANMLSMLKSGTTKLALDRVANLAKALEVDPARLFQMALLQSGHETTRPVITAVFGTIVTRNEVGWLEAIREASGDTDPALTARARASIFGTFGK